MYLKQFRINGKYKILSDHLVSTAFKDVDKGEFSVLMKRLLEADGFKRHDAIYGFEKTVIYPLNREKIKIKNYLWDLF